MGLVECIQDIGNVTCQFVHMPPSYESQKGWQNFFEGNTDFIVFFLSTASFCQTLAEDSSKNSLMSALARFESLCAEPLLAKSNFLLVLNKIDLLEQRLKKYQIKDYLSFYQGIR